ncbi:hypothetical protein [Desulfobacula toluolica]|uniref:Uncharacterized protein n=1 Tax=Desulfobacula toluolica (strain DSM 7467 / Tol2) TaxID=651182 RepID=K0NLQ9_DESTT|nr:hypothetical protein [Desulfobacula toluolica]CCK81685.1 uncharacterized protein TOL2_C35280 [Desulfobacula toluolica Tol2]
MSFYIPIILIVFLAFYFFIPYRNWPPDPHFGSYGIWSLFYKKENARQFITGAIGLSRAYMFFIVKMIVQLSNNRCTNTLVKILMWAMVMITGELVFYISAQILQMPNWLALFAATTFLFSASRPQMLPTYLNGEQFYMVISSISMILLFKASTYPINDQPQSLLILWAFLLFGAAVFTKINFILEPFIIGCLYWSQQNFSIYVFQYILLGCLPALFFYLLLIKKYSFKGAINNYSWYLTKSGWLKTISISNQYRLLKDRYEIALKHSPLAIIFLAAVWGAWSYSPKDNISWLLVAWLIATLINIATQFRFELYHFYVLIPPASILTVMGFQSQIEAQNSIGIVCLSFLLIVGARRSILNFPQYYKNKPLSKHMGQAITVYQYYWDLRISQVESHCKTYEGPFLAWGIVPQIYYMTKRAPLCTYTFFHYNTIAAPMQDTLQTQLLTAIKEKKPCWIYDFNCWNTRYGPLNPLTLSILTGQSYAPAYRREHLIYYQLCATSKKKYQMLHIQDQTARYRLHVYKSQSLDLFHDELRISGIEVSALSPIWHMDIDELLISYKLGHYYCCSELRTIEEKLSKTIINLTITRLFLSIFFLHQKQNKTAEEYLNSWVDITKKILPTNSLLRLAPNILYRLMDQDESIIHFENESLNILPIRDGFDFSFFCIWLGLTGITTEVEQLHFYQLLTDLIEDKSEYKDPTIDIMETSLLRLREIIIDRKNHKGGAEPMPWINLDHIANMGENSNWYNLKIYIALLQTIMNQNNTNPRNDKQKNDMHILDRI